MIKFYLSGTMINNSGHITHDFGDKVTENFEEDELLKILIFEFL